MQEPILLNVWRSNGEEQRVQLYADPEHEAQVGAQSWHICVGVG